MKVLLINVCCGVGSTGRICTDLATQFKEHGHDVKIAYGRDDVPEQYKEFAIRIGNDLDWKLHALQTRIFDTHGFCSNKATIEFLKWAEDYNPDLLWLHNLHGYYINVEMLFAWIKKRPKMEVKWTLHDCWAFTGHCAHFSIAKCEQWKTECRECVQKNRYPQCLLFSNVKKNYQRKRAAFTGVQNLTLITPSQWLANLTRESFLKDYPVEVHYNIIDKTVFKPTPSDLRKRLGLEDKFIVLGVANVWEERKGLKDFYKLAQMLDDRYAIVLVGLYENQIRGLPKNIKGIKRTNSPEELAAIYTIADVFINLTYEDNYPTVNLEAQACGTPVITYDTGGCKETIYTEESKIVNTGNIDEVILYIKQCELKIDINTISTEK